MVTPGPAGELFDRLLRRPGASEDDRSTSVDARMRERRSGMRDGDGRQGIIRRPHA
ncbi:hypothetical protein ACFPN0_04490 [Kitasatospora cinereorecta]